MPQYLIIRVLVKPLSGLKSLNHYNQLNLKNLPIQTYSIHTSIILCTHKYIHAGSVIVTKKKM